MNNNTVSEPIELLNQSTNKSWCPIPWITCSTTTNGHYRLCVQANTDRKTRGLFYDDNEKPLTAKNHTIKESRNSKLAKDVRKSMLQGKLHSACIRCKEEEKSGLASRRAISRYYHDNTFNNINFTKIQKHTQEDGSIDPDDFPLKDLDIRMGNRCNLKCRSCYPGESSGWYKEWFETQSQKFQSGEQTVELEKRKNIVIANNNTLDWAEDSKLISHLFNDTPELELLAIVGGEPLLIEEHFKALESYVNANKAKDIIIDYNTNMTALPKEALDLWKEFKEVKIGYSIDGIGPVNDYIRFPSKWENIEKNLRQLDKADGNFDIWPTVTIMAYNALYIPEIIKWQIESQFKKQNKTLMTQFIVHHPLRNPPEMSAQVLPMEVKNFIIQKYKAFQIGWFENYISENFDTHQQDQWRHRIEYIFSSIINRFMESDLSHLLPNFLSRTEAMDNYRNQNFATSLPELYNELKPYIKN